MNDKISIIMPVYNTGNLVSKSLEALSAQTYQNIEVICVDDGSTDNTLEVLRAYAEKDTRVKVFTQENGGPGKARNKGLDEASGKYIMFCDSDDWYEPNMCEEMHKAITQNDCDVAMCRCCFEFEEGSDSEKVKAFRGLTDKYFNPKKIQKDLKESRLSVNVILWNKIFKKEIIDKYQMRFLEENSHDDDAFWFSYGFVANRIFYLKKVLHHYLIRSNSIMGNMACKISKYKNEHMNIIRHVFAFLKRHNLIRENEFQIAQMTRIVLKNGREMMNELEMQRNIDEVNQFFKKNFIMCFRLVFCDENVILLDDEKTILSIYVAMFWYKLNALLLRGEKQAKFQRRVLRAKYFLEYHKAQDYLKQNRETQC